MNLRNGKIVIFKLDDLKDEKCSLDRYSQLSDWAAESRTSLSFGLICNSLDSTNEKYFNILKNMLSNQYIEIWCHGYTHIETGDALNGYHAEFNATLDEQILTLQKCSGEFHDKLNASFSTLGPPHGHHNFETGTALEKTPTYKIYMNNREPHFDKCTFIHLTNIVNIEESLGKLYDLDKLKNIYMDDSLSDYIVFQGHALWWSDEDVLKFKLFATWLRRKGAIFMTPIAYYKSIREEF